MKKILYYFQKIRNGKLNEVIDQFKWIMQYMKEYYLHIVIYTLLGMSGIVVSLLSGLNSRDLVDIITGHKTGELLKTFLIMIVITLGNTLIGQLASYMSTRINIKIDNGMKTKFFKEIMESDWEYLSQYHSGEIMMRWTGDVSSVSSNILGLFPNYIITLFQFASALYMVIKYDWTFAVITLITMPIGIYTSRATIRRLRRSNMSTLNVSTKISSFNQETFGNIQIVKAFDMIPTYIRRLDEIQKEYTDVRINYQKVSMLNALVMQIISMIAKYIAYGWGIYKVWRGDISYGTMTLFISLSAGLSTAIDRFISMFPSTIGFTNAIKRLRAILDIPKEDFSQREEVREFFETNESQGVGICLRDVSYGYYGGEDVFIGANIEAHPHETIAFVGPSGEGKTTMLRVLLALVRCREGQGYLCAGNTVPEDGECMDLTASVRQLMAYVPQGNSMMSGTIAQNMRNVKEDATDEEIIEALKMACAWKFVEKLPDGIYSEIKERGGGFSEGQAQRLSIARALLRKSPILLLDEATSALDIQTEREVLKNIMQDEYPRTCIVTTHRPTVLTVCNRVYAIREQECVTLTEKEINDLISVF